MSLNYLLTWIVPISCLFQLWHLLRSGSLRGALGWVFVNLSVVAILVAGIAFWPERAGIVAAALWLLLLVAPIQMAKRAARSVLKREYGNALFWARLTRLLHPFDGWLQIPELYRGLSLADSGKLQEARKILSEHASGSSSMRRYASLELYRLSQEWDGLIEFIQSHSEKVVLNDPAMLSYYIRALGEVGRVNDMLRLYHHTSKLLLNSGTAVSARMFVLAFAGRRASLLRLLAGPLRDIPDKVKLFWILTCDLASGSSEPIPADIWKLFKQHRVDDHDLQASLERRLAFPPKLAETELNAESHKILTLIENDLDHEDRYDLGRAGAQIDPIATKSIIALNVAVYLIALLFSYENTVIKGALIPELVHQGEWWRIFSAQFLHIGWLHLTVNMLCLLGLGRMIEASTKIYWYVALYFAIGTGAMLTIYFLNYQDINSSQQLFVGASGGIMGLVGANAAILIRGWLKDRSHLASRRLGEIGVLLLIQTCFDLSTPSVSFTGHISGALIGLMLGLFLPLRKTQSS